MRKLSGYRIIYAVLGCNWGFYVMGDLLISLDNVAGNYCLVAPKRFWTWVDYSVTVTLRLLSTMHKEAASVELEVKSCLGQSLLSYNVLPCRRPPNLRASIPMKSVA